LLSLPTELLLLILTQLHSHAPSLLSLSLTSHSLHNLIYPTLRSAYHHLTDLTSTSSISTWHGNKKYISDEYVYTRNGTSLTVVGDPGVVYALSWVLENPVAASMMRKLKTTIGWRRGGRVLDRF